MTPGILATIFPWMPSVGGVIALAMAAIGRFLSGAGAAAAGIVLDRTAAAIAPVAIPVCWSLHRECSRYRSDHAGQRAVRSNWDCG